MMYTLRITYILTILCHIIYAENLSPSEEVQLESVVRTVETSRIRRSIISRLFREYSSVLTQQLLQAKLEATQEDSREENEIPHSNIRYAAPGQMKRINFPYFSNYAAPTIEIKVEGENHFNQHMQSVALAPEMSTYDAMNAARNMYAYTNVNSLHNPYILEMRLWERRCAIITSLGGEEGRWMVRVTDENGQVLSDDICIPRRSEMIIRPGYKILIKKVTQETTSQPPS